MVTEVGLFVFEIVLLFMFLCYVQGKHTIEYDAGKGTPFLQIVILLHIFIPYVIKLLIYLIFLRLKGFFLFILIKKKTIKIIIMILNFLAKYY